MLPTQTHWLNSEKDCFIRATVRSIRVFQSGYTLLDFTSAIPMQGFFMMSTFQCTSLSNLSSKLINFCIHKTRSHNFDTS